MIHRVNLQPSTIRAFTLIELLTVIAVIGILAALIFPSVGAARRSAARAKTKVQFSQWATAIESFRGEYGYYPAFHVSALVNGEASTVASTDHLFHDLLAAARRDGSPLSPSSSAAMQNRKLIRFYTFSEDDFSNGQSATANLLSDAFGNTEIVVLVDRNLDGVINSQDYVEWPAVRAADGSQIRPSEADIPPVGIRIGVAFYSVSPNATNSNPEFVLSWK